MSQSFPNDAPALTAISLEDLQDLLERVLVGANTSRDNASAVAAGLVAAEADGYPSHGASRAPYYADQARRGTVDGHADARLTQPSAAVVRVDARDGFAVPAVTRGLAQARTTVSSTGIVAVGVTHSHHFGMASYHIEPLARDGLLALAFSNSPAGVAPAGGSRAVFGTNPIALAAPRADDDPLVVDLALTHAARGKVLVAARAGQPIPEGWALDAEGRPTTNAEAALAGTMLPMGGAKGAALVLVVEVLAAALTGAHFGYEASSFFSDEGPPARIGHLLLVVDPAAFGTPNLAQRVDALCRTILDQPGTRLPGARRFADRARARREGVRLPTALYDELHARSRRSRG